MGIIEVLKKNKVLVFWNRCRIHRKEPEFIEHVLNGYQNPEYLHLHSYGDAYKGETIYLVDEQGGGVGFFAELGVTLIKLYFADERGFTPYVHWGKNYLYYEADGIDGEKNAFLHYFAPVSHVTGIHEARHVVKSEMRHYEQVKSLFGAVSYDVSEEYVDAMADMMKKYIRYNEKTECYLKQQYKGLLGDKRTLGVHYRGTDFRKQYNNHPVAVRIEQTLEEADRLMRTGKYEQIFLATDENEAVAKFKEVFGEKVKVYPDTFRDDGGDDSIAFSESQREHHKYLLGLEVLRDEYTLTNCEGLVCGYSNVTFLTRIMRKAWHERAFEDYVLINNGIYHNSNNFWESGHGNKN
ncbi:MAG: O-fucosyltransferase family protein [Lachnospiraceae bacterium]|nr:O-fucosyltransferase family protein [Lachnospiraceae bacterium]